MPRPGVSQTPAVVQRGEVLNAEEVLSKHYQPGLPDLEIILSYSIFTRAISGINEINPFGHIAIAMVNKEGHFEVVTPNQKAVSGQGPLLLHMSPAEYYYGVKPLPEGIHGSNFGLAYARSSISIQLRGLSNDALRNMRNMSEKIDHDHAEGSTAYCAYTNNCSHLATEILKAGGIIEKASDKAKFPTAVFEQLIRSIKANPQWQMSTTVIARVGSGHKYAHEHTPLPAHRIFASLLSIIGVKTGLPHLGSGNSIRMGPEGLLTIQHKNRLNVMTGSCSRLWMGTFLRSSVRGLMSRGLPILR